VREDLGWGKRVGWWVCVVVAQKERGRVLLESEDQVETELQQKKKKKKKKVKLSWRFQ
jgi:hypothetical protein